MLRDIKQPYTIEDRERDFDKYGPAEAARRVIMHDCEERQGKVIWATIEGMLCSDIPVVKHAAESLLGPIIGIDYPENRNILIRVDKVNKRCSLIVSETSWLVLGRTFFTGCDEFRILTLVHEAKHIELLQENSSTEYPNRLQSEKQAINAELDAFIVLAERRPGLSNLIPGYQEMLDLAQVYEKSIDLIIHLYAWLHLERPALNTTEIQGIVEESLRSNCRLSTRAGK